MILGVDFDNTLVCYDGLFHAGGVASGLLPADAPTDKRGVRDWLLARGREDDFTLLQGSVYGRAIHSAPAYPGALDCLRDLKNRGAEIFIVSHKTLHPVLGPAYDLRRAASNWLRDNGFFANGLLTPAEVFFEVAQTDKACRAAELACTHFIDDMRRFLLHPLFPAGTEKLWFTPGPGPENSPAPENDGSGLLVRVSSWAEIALRLGA